jgi:NAD(P)-dependent dehydrogenase (short-subunit alcohol dehydrogenase family)
MTDENRAVIVTGAGGAGCGQAISARSAIGGAVVVVSDIGEAGGHDTVRLIERRGGRAAFFRADVRNESQVRIAVCAQMNNPAKRVGHRLSRFIRRGSSWVR